MKGRLAALISSTFEVIHSVLICTVSSSHRPFLGQYGTNATPPASKDSVFNCSELLRLKEMRASGAPSRMARSSTGKHFCQSELKGTVEKRSLRAGCVAFDILWYWKNDHLQTSEYSLQVKYQGEVTTTTENAQEAPPHR